MGKEDELVGLFFHILSEDKKIQYKGEISLYLHEGYYLCDVFEWVSSDTSFAKIYHISQMTNWNIYYCVEQMDEYNNWENKHG